MMAFEKRSRRMLARSLEGVLLIAIIVAVWLVMVMPVVIYFLPLNAGSPSSSGEQLDQNGSNSSTEMVSECQNMSNSDGESNITGVLICQENFFFDPISSVCKPSCSSWLMFSRSDTIVSRVFIGISTAIGILTTVVIIILSFARYRNMLTFPSVLILYQDIVVSLHGVNLFIGYADRRLYCPDEDLVVSYEAPATPYCTISGLISGQVVLPLAIWITIQVGYTLLAVRSPFYFKRLTTDKRKGHILHIASLVAGAISVLFPFFVVFGVGGYSLIDTLFPPIVCIARNRDVSAYVVLVPLGILMAVIITLLVLILHQLVRSRCMRKNTIASKDDTIKKAEIKVYIICLCYVVLGLAASLAYSISSAFLDDLQRELMSYFECERCGVNSGRMCDRSGFESLTNPPLVTIGYSIFVLYPLITLVYIVRWRREPQTKNGSGERELTSKSTSTSLQPSSTINNYYVNNNN